MARKIEAWEKQHQALMAPAYRITLTDSTGQAKPWNLGKGKGPKDTAGIPGERYYTADEIKDMLPMLSAKNAQGRNIYITPIDERHHYMVLDDTTRDQVGQLRAEGFRPALTQESSPGNIQAIFKVDKMPGNTEQQAANDLVRKLNKEYGDPNFTGVVHPFRMAGFTNAKPKYKNAQGNAPFVRIQEADGGECQKMDTFLEESRKAHLFREMQEAEQAAKKMAKERREVIKMADSGRYASDRGVVGQFLLARKKWEGLARSEGWRVDDSAVDFRACKDLLERFRPEKIKQALMDHSPAIEVRHRDIERYASETVAAAQKTRQEERGASPDRGGPSMGR